MRYKDAMFYNNRVILFLFNEDIEIFSELIIVSPEDP